MVASMAALSYARIPNVAALSQLQNYTYRVCGMQYDALICSAGCVVKVRRKLSEVLSMPASFFYFYLRGGGVVTLDVCPDRRPPIAATRPTGALVVSLQMISA